MVGIAQKIHLDIDYYSDPTEIMIKNGTTHDIKVTPELVKKLDVEVWKKPKFYVQKRVMFVTLYESK